MALFPIRTFGDPVLRTVAEPVEVFDDALQKLVDDLMETMYDAPGVGLAAPQIGISKRVFVFDDGDGAQVMVNPEIVEQSDEWEFDEGCLSVPGYYWPITRSSYAVARGFDPSGQAIEVGGDELLGRVLQHEIDHLNGILLVERLDKRARKAALRDIRNDTLGLVE